MNYNIYGMAISFEYPVLGLKLKTKEDKAILELFYKSLLNNRFLKVDLESYYYARIQTDELILKLNKKHRKTLVDITISILEMLDCNSFSIQYNDFDYNTVTCVTPFGVRTIRVLRFCYLFPINSGFSDGTIGIPLISSKGAGLLNFKTETGGMDGIISDDYTKHNEMIKSKLFDAFPILKNASIIYVNSQSFLY